MGAKTEISWTDHTFNPWWGCVKISAACTHCYAATFAGRFNVQWGPRASRRFFDLKHWQEPLKWDRKAEREGVRRRVFCASMADVFEALPDDHPDAEQMVNERMRLWGLVESTPNLDWLLLTKRPENIPEMVPYGWMRGAGFPANVWCGTTAEDQQWADERIPALLKVPCAVRFLSCEPLLGPVDLCRVAGEIDCLRGVRRYGAERWQYHTNEPVVRWAIVGGESGPGARPMHPEWARNLRDQCAVAGVAFHFKQWGEWQNGSAGNSPTACVLNDGRVLRPWGPDEMLAAARIKPLENCNPTVMALVGKKAAGRLLDGRTWDEFPM